MAVCLPSLIAAHTSLGRKANSTPGKSTLHPISWDTVNTYLTDRVHAKESLMKRVLDTNNGKIVVTF